MSNQRPPSARRAPAKPFLPREHAHPAPPIDREKAVAELKRFLDLMVREMNLDVVTEVKAAASGESSRDEADVLVTFEGPDQELLLERDAELLLALEHVGHRWLKLDPRLHDRVRFDCGDYRSTRLADLKLSARVAAQRVRETGEPFRFNPMSSRERRIIHLDLNGAAGIRTASEGSGDHRQLVIYPTGKKP